MDECNPFIGLWIQPSPGIVRNKHDVPVCWIFAFGLLSKLKKCVKSHESRQLPIDSAYEQAPMCYLFQQAHGLWRVHEMQARSEIRGDNNQ